jgi:large subunit ribosomal protein L17
MRHGDKVNNLGRKKGHRHALLKNMSHALIVHKRITTTLAKAKALRKHIEPMITRSKDNSTLNRRVVFSYLQNKEAIKELFDVVGPAVANRPGGYVRVIRLGYRHGDAAEMALIELVDFNTDYNANSSVEQKAKGRRGRRGGAKKKPSDAMAAVAAPVAAAGTEVGEDPEMDKLQSMDNTASDTQPTEEA